MTEVLVVGNDTGIKLVVVDRTANELLGGVEFFTCTAGSSRVVVDGKNKIVGAVVVELCVEDDAVPTFGKVERTCVDGSQFAEGDRGGGVAEIVK